MENFGIPRRIVCLTEESVETLYLLGRQNHIVGVSAYVVRPKERLKHPIVSAFINGKIEKIIELQPDLVIGFSDIQKDLARELIGAGLNVYIANHRGLDQVLEYVVQLGRIVGEEKKALKLVETWQLKREAIMKSVLGQSFRPKVYFEEWDDPMISCIKWVDQLIEVCGGDNIFSERKGSLATDRIVTSDQVQAANPDLILACWCGKKVKLNDIKKRQGWEKIAAVKNNRVLELPPEIFLQPGPALFIDGLDQMKEVINATRDRHE